MGLRAARPDVWLFSTSGGTDLCTAFVGACPLLPVYAGELQARCLGAAVEAWDEDGRPLVDEVGELVITKPMPSMPLYFWNDPDGERYRSSYFDMYPGRVAPRRLDQDHRPRRRRSSTGARTRRSTAAASAWARARSTAPSRECPRCSTASWWTSRTGSILFVVLREALDGRAGRRDPAPRARALLAAARPGPDRPDRRGAAHALEQEARGAGEEDPAGRRPESAASRDSLANPAALDWFADFSARAG